MSYEEAAAVSCAGTAACTCVTGVTAPLSAATPLRGTRLLLLTPVCLSAHTTGTSPRWEPAHATLTAGKLAVFFSFIVMQKIFSPWGLWQLRKLFSKQTLEANTALHSGTGRSGVKQPLSLDTGICSETFVLLQIWCP